MKSKTSKALCKYTSCTVCENEAKIQYTHKCNQYQYKVQSSSARPGTAALTQILQQFFSHPYIFLSFCMLI